MVRECPICHYPSLEYNPKIRLLWCVRLACDYRELNVDEALAKEKLNEKDRAEVLGRPYKNGWVGADE